MEWKALIVCGTEELGGCTFEHLILLANNLIHNLILLSTLLAVISFAYAGIILLTSGGNPGAKTQAKAIFKKVLIGYLWILSAWLLVYTITKVLLIDGFSLLNTSPLK